MLINVFQCRAHDNETRYSLTCWPLESTRAKLCAHFAMQKFQSRLLVSLIKCYHRPASDDRTQGEILFRIHLDYAERFYHSPANSCLNHQCEPCGHLRTILPDSCFLCCLVLPCDSGLTSAVDRKHCHLRVFSHLRVQTKVLADLCVQLDFTRLTSLVLISQCIFVSGLAELQHKFEEQQYNLQNESFLCGKTSLKIVASCKYISLHVLKWLGYFKLLLAICQELADSTSCISLKFQNRPLKTVFELRNRRFKFTSSKTIAVFHITYFHQYSLMQCNLTAQVCSSVKMTVYHT